MPDYSQLKDASDNLYDLLKAQNDESVDAGKQNGKEPFAVLVTKAVFNASAKSGASGGVLSVNGMTGTVSLTKSSLSLGNVPNVDATNASNISSGTIPNARFPSILPTASGINLTSLNASNLTAGTISGARLPATTGDVSSPGGSTVNTLATVNSGPGSFGDTLNVPVITVNAKGLVTASSSVAIAAGQGNVVAPSNFAADNRIVRSDGIVKNVQPSPVGIDDSGNVSGVNDLDVSGTQTVADATVTGTFDISTASFIGQLPVVAGGTGRSSLTVYAPLFGGTTSTGAVQSGTVGTSGQVLTSNGAGALPTFQNAAASASFPWYDAKLNYNASASATTTTGSVSSGSPTLTVASASTFAINQGILVKGAGTSGAHLVTTISNIVGTTITLGANAATTVSGAVVQHDDTVAINTAIAACYNAGGGTVLLRNGVYRCNGPFNGSTNSILTLPQNIVVDFPRKVAIIGESRIGTGLICDDHPTASGTDPSFFAGAPNVADTFTQWESVDIGFFNLSIGTETNPTIHGLNFANCLMAEVDCLTVYGNGAPSAPTHGTCAIIMPREHNEIKSLVGAVAVGFFDTGLRVYEHCNLRRPQIGGCKVGVEISNATGYSLHLISGSICVENSQTVIKKTGTGKQSVNLSIENEVTTAGSLWYDTVLDINDASDTLYGDIRYSSIINETGLDRSFSQSGASSVYFRNLYSGNSGTPTNNAPIAQYDLANLNDSIGSFTLTDHGTITFVAGQNGNCALFNGTTQYATNTALNPAAGSFTVCGWFNLTSTANAGIIASQHTYAGPRWHIFQPNTGIIFTGFDNTATPVSATAPNTLAANTWYFLAVTYNSSTHDIRIKIDNSGSWTVANLTGGIYTGGVPIFALGTDLNGDSGNAPADLWAGKLDTFKVYNYVLSDGELTALFTA